MPKKHKGDERRDMKDLWIAPRYSLKTSKGERTHEPRPGSVPDSSRFLELADIALGLRKPAPHKKKLGQPPAAHEMRKTEPYSNK
ncbi:MAG TPA: hypothetical protein VKH81_07190 [Candidatus Angelobacter sp.]|nr:hypothetical protein [Candidatus Angelobacter sp.]